MLPTYFETVKKLEKIIAEHKPKKKFPPALIVFSVILFVGVVVLFRFRPFGIIVGIILAFIVNMLTFIFKDKKGLENIAQLLRKNEAEKAYDLLKSFYKKNKSDDLRNVIISYYNESGEPQRAEKFELSEEWESYRKKDKTLDRVYQNTLKTLDYIENCNQNITNFKNKKEELVYQTQKVEDEKILKGYFQAVESYDEMIGLEKSKLKFYTNSKGELLKIKNYKVEKLKLQEVTNELKKTEQEYYKKSLVENELTADQIVDNLQYEKDFLEALEELSETISNAIDEKDFRELKQKFDEKNKQI